MPLPFSIFGVYGSLFRNFRAPDPETASSSNTPWCQESDEVPLEEQDLPDPFSKGPLKVPTTSTTTAKKEGALTDKWIYVTLSTIPRGFHADRRPNLDFFCVFACFFQGHFHYYTQTG